MLGDTPCEPVRARTVVVGGSRRALTRPRDLLIAAGGPTSRRWAAVGPGADPRLSVTAPGGWPGHALSTSRSAAAASKLRLSHQARLCDKGFVEVDRPHNPQLCWDALPDLLTLGETADYLRCSTEQVKRLVRSGRLAGAVDLGLGKHHCYRIPKRSIEGILSQPAARTESPQRRRPRSG